MSLFGWGEQKVLEAGSRTAGTVTKVHTCWYVKVNTKPARVHAMDGAAFPHVITFRYAVDGAEYTGRRFLWANVQCPQNGENISVYYDPEKPRRWAVATGLERL